MDRDALMKTVEEVLAINSVGQCEWCDGPMTGRAKNARFCGRDCQVKSLNAGGDRHSDSGPTVLLRLPPELKDALRQAAEDRDVSMNWLALRLIDDGLKRLVPVSELRLTRS